MVNHCVSLFAQYMGVSNDRAYSMIIERQREYKDAMGYVGDIVGEPYKQLVKLDREIKQMRRRFFSAELRREEAYNHKHDRIYPNL